MSPGEWLLRFPDALSRHPGPLPNASVPPTFTVLGVIPPSFICAKSRVTICRKPS